MAWLASGCNPAIIVCDIMLYLVAACISIKLDELIFQQILQDWP